MFNQDDVERAIERESARLNSPLEDNDFLNDLDKGYIGYSKPQIKHVGMTPEERLQSIQGDWPEKDNDPASPEQAWA